MPRTKTITKSFDRSIWSFIGNHTRSSSSLTKIQKENALKKLCNSGPFPWKQLDGREGIQKTFHFTDFNQAWSFMSRSALLAEKMDHHPEWFNVYNVVEVTLTTHDKSGLSVKDIQMAERMDQYAVELLPFRTTDETSEQKEEDMVDPSFSQIKVEHTKN